MRIGYLISEYPAISHTFIRREVQELRRRGFQIDCISMRRSKDVKRLSLQDQLEFAQTWFVLPPRILGLIWSHVRSLVVHPLRYFCTLADALRHRNPGIKALLWAFFYFIEALYIADEVERRKITRLHNHFSNAAAIVGYLVSRHLGIPWSITLHGSADFDGPGRSLLKAKARSANFIACVSYFGRAQTLRWIDPEDWDKVIICRCGVDLGVLPEKVSKAQGTVRICCVGRLAPEKGHAGLIEAFAKVLATGSDVVLTIVGEGPERVHLEQLVVRYKIEGRVRLPGLGNEKEVFDEIARSDIFVLPSFMEGLPVVLMEAMAIGVPVVAPCLAGIPELVESGKSGLLFHSSDWEGLAEQLSRMIEDSSLRQISAREGRIRVEEEFDIGRTVEPIVERFHGA